MICPTSPSRRLNAGFRALRLHRIEPIKVEMAPRTSPSPSRHVAPRATVVLSFHNQQHLVEEALGSLLRQQGDPIRIHVLDDGSVDGTWDQITRLVERSDAGGHDVRTSRFVQQLGIARLTRALASVDTEFAVVARAEDCSRPERIERLIHTLDSTEASVVVSDRTRLGGSVLEHLADSRRQGSGLLPPRDVAFQVASLPTNLGTMAIRPNVLLGFPEFSSARLADELGPLLAFRGSILKGCFYLDEQLVDYKPAMAVAATDLRSRETCREGLFAELIATRVAMLQDLRSLSEPGVDEAASRVRLEASLKGVLVELAERWSQAREDLWQNDLRPTWIHPDDQPTRAPVPVEPRRDSLLRRVRTLAFGLGRRAAA